MKEEIALKARNAILESENLRLRVSDLEIEKERLTEERKTLSDIIQSQPDIGPEAINAIRNRLTILTLSSLTIFAIGTMGIRIPRTC